jgi:exodeoxyribonuclease VII small subunit
MAIEKFEEAMQRLEEVVQSLESGELSLDDSLKVFEEGMRLARYCSDKLEEAERKVTMLVQEGGGENAQVPFDSNEAEKEPNDT